ncbi:MAG: efflux RND transporter periplasmic adaptor subunit [Termitinemataceae bacterium]
MKRAKVLGTLVRFLVPLVILGGAIWYTQLIATRRTVISNTPPIPVRVQKPVLGDLVRSLRVNGYVESETMVTVLPLVSGALQALNVDVGDRVRKDQIIAQIDPERYRLQLQQAEAAYLSAKSTFDRVSQLYSANATSAQNYEQARGQAEAYWSQYELAKLQYEYTQVRSPLDGVVLKRHLSVGSLAAPERPLVTIADLNTLVIRCQIPERYYGQFAAAQQGTSSGAQGSSTFASHQLNTGILQINIVRSDGSTYPGNIRSISPYVSAETKNFEGVVAVDSGAKNLRPGMFVRVFFELARIKDVYTLPFAALTGGSSLWYVEDGRARRAEVQITESNDTAFVVGPEWKDRDVVIEGAYFLREGAAVVVRP